MDDPSATLTPPLGTGRVERSSPALIRALQSDRPLDEPICHRLIDVDAVAIGRGAGLGDRPAVRERVMSIPLPDAMVSREHARLQARDGSWSIDDAASKNGTRVNGVRTAAAPLADGDVIEIGQTFFVYRSRYPESDPPLIAGIRSFSPSFLEALAAAGRAGPSTVPVVLVGATGTGKEVMATALHEASKRKGPFVAVNCGAIPEKLIESELFGYRRGAFSGADEDREGLVRRADGGTLFLDEVGELSAKAQVALLRVLQEKEVLPVGATRPVEVDVRIVAAAQTELGELVREERFRADLLARLSGIVIVLPRLAERKEDVGLLVSLLLRRVAGPRAASLKLSIAAVRALFAYDWPLNVRELERALESAVLLAGAGTIDLPHLPKTVQEAEHAPTSPPVASPTANRDRIVELLQSSRGNVSAVARAMGKTRAQIHRWIKQYSLDVRAFRR